MHRPEPRFSLPVRLAHALAIMLLVATALTGLRLAWFLRQEWISPYFWTLLETVIPRGNQYHLHAIFGTLFAAVGLWHLGYLLISGEHRRLTNLFHRFEYSFTKKLVYLLSLVAGAVSVMTGFSIYAGIFHGAPGYLFNSFVHHWCFRLLVLFAVLHLIEVIISLRSRINLMFFARRFVGFLQWPAALVSLAVGLVGGVALWAMMNQPAVLRVPNIGRTAVVDGLEYDIEWFGAESTVVQTYGGANFQSGAAPVTIKVFRNRRRLFVLLRWPDPTRSLNRHIIRTDTNWQVESSDFTGPFGEDIYYEDQVSLFFSTGSSCAATCHLATPRGALGRHYTPGDTADVWTWMAAATNPVSEADDRWWGPLSNDTTGGRHFDNKASGGYRLNLDPQWNQPYFRPTTRVMRDYIAYGTGWYEPFEHAHDTFAVATRFPALLVAPATGDRGDVTARGRWRNGWWTVELSRNLNTGSPADIALRGEVSLGVAVFDNAEKKHTFHLKPIHMIVE